jgi:hypothetical protein
MMKCIATILLFLSAVEAFVPSVSFKTKTISSTANYALADRVFGLDLFAPNKDQNNYGARTKKNVEVGKISEKSYVPSGLTVAEYDKIRKDQQKKREENYSRNVKKAGVFINYTEWYLKRGTDLKGDWKKSVTLGHNMAKTKFDWSGTQEAKAYDGSTTEKFTQDIFGRKKAVPAKKIPLAKKTLATKTTEKKSFSFW